MTAIAEMSTQVNDFVRHNLRHRSKAHGMSTQIRPGVRILVTRAGCGGES